MKEILKRGSFQFPFQNYNHTYNSNQFIVSAHWHDEVEILYVTKGTIDLLIDETIYTVNAGDIYFINSGVMHQMTAGSDGVKFIAYIFPLEYLSFDVEDYTQQQIITPLINKELLFPTKLMHLTAYTPIKNHIIDLAMTDTTRNTGYQLTTKVALYSIINILYIEKLFINSKKSYSLSTNKKIVSYLNQHYIDSITLEDISNHVSVSTNYFCRYFKQQFGKTLIEYINFLRIEKACILLESEDLPIVDIAMDVGFNNISYFNRQFKSIMNTTPKLYRSQKKEAQT